MLDRIDFTYDAMAFDWINSKLYYFLCDHYGLNEVGIVLNDDTIIRVDKYNVIGYIEGNNFITLYNNIGELHPITLINLEKIKYCKTLHGE